MTPSDRTPGSQSHQKHDGKSFAKLMNPLAVLGSVYLLCVSGLRFLGHAICSSGGCGPDDGPYGGGWENCTVAVLVILAVVAPRVVARSRGHWSDSQVAVTWLAAVAIVLFALPFLF